MRRMLPLWASRVCVCVPFPLYVCVSGCRCFFSVTCLSVFLSDCTSDARVCPCLCLYVFTWLGVYVYVRADALACLCPRVCSCVASPEKSLLLGRETAPDAHSHDLVESKRPRPVRRSRRSSSECRLSWAQTAFRCVDFCGRRCRGGDLMQRQACKTGETPDLL